MNTRMKAIRLALEMNQEEFAKKVGVTPTAISRIERGNRSVTDQMKKAIIHIFDVTPEYLELGIEPMFKEVDDGLEELARRVIICDNPRAKAFLKIAATLPDEQLALLEDIMRRTLAEVDIQSAKKP